MASFGVATATCAVRRIGQPSQPCRILTTQLFVLQLQLACRCHAARAATRSGHALSPAPCRLHDALPLALGSMPRLRHTCQFAAPCVRSTRPETTLLSQRLLTVVAQALCLVVDAQPFGYGGQGSSPSKGALILGEPRWPWSDCDGLNNLWWRARPLLCVSHFQGASPPPCDASHPAASQAASRRARCSCACHYASFGIDKASCTTGDTVRSPSRPSADASDQRGHTTEAVQMDCSGVDCCRAHRGLFPLPDGPRRSTVALLALTHGYVAVRTCEASSGGAGSEGAGRCQAAHGPAQHGLHGRHPECARAQPGPVAASSLA